MKTSDMRSYLNNKFLLILQFQGKRFVEEAGSFMFEQTNLIPAEIMKILTFIEGALQGYAENVLKLDVINFEIRAVATPSDSSLGQNWLATLVAFQPLTHEHQQTLHALACHLLARITHGCNDMFSGSVDSTLRFDQLASIDELVEKFLNSNGGKHLQQMFSVLPELNSKVGVLISGCLREPEAKSFVPTDLSGDGLVDGFRESRNEIYLFPVLNHRVVGRGLTFRCSDSSVFRMLADAHINNKKISYSARTALNSNGRSVENELLAVEVIDDEPFELE